jgi:hypothetical protein
MAASPDALSARFGKLALLLIMIATPSGFPAP